MTVLFVSIHGLDEVIMGELVEFGEGIIGIDLNLELYLFIILFFFN